MAREKPGFTPAAPQDPPAWARPAPEAPTEPTEAEVNQGHNERLGRVLYWIGGVAFAIAAVELVAGLLLPYWRLLVGALIAMLVGVFMILAGRSLASGLQGRGAALIVVGLFAAAGAYTLVLPGAISSLALLPVIVIAVVLPFLHDAALKRSLVAAWAAGLALIIVNIAWAPPTQLPITVTTVFRIFAFAAVLALTLTLLFHHHKRLNATLERTRSDARALKEAHERLQETARAKNRFLNLAAHELRTPLTPVLIQLELLRTHPTVDKDPRLQRSMRLITRNVERLKSHVDDLLDIARLQSGRFKLRLQDIPVDPLLEDLADSFQDVADAHQVTLTVRPTGGQVVHADPERLVQILYNLVANAIKATPAGGRILVETHPDDAALRFFVTDTGRGIRAEDRSRLFQPFEQLAGQDDSSGAGLGLFISRILVEAQGGQIDCTSAGPGQGATFHFSIPQAPRTEPGDAARADKRRPSAAAATGERELSYPPTQTP